MFGLSDSLVSGVVTVLTAIVGVAIIAVIVSKRADTANVIGAAGEAFSRGLGAAVSPVTGGGSYFGNTGFTGGAPIISY